MSKLTERRKAWNTLEAARALLFVGASYDPNIRVLAAHQREDRVLTLAESIAEHGDFRAAHLMPPAEQGEIWEAQELAAE